MSSDENAKARFAVVPKVEKLHQGQNPHINSLIDRLDDVIREYGDEVHERGGIITYAEIIGTLTCLQHDYLNKTR